jgi:ferric-dicitrate binding protein FerR (iron transport regulator)
MTDWTDLEPRLTPERSAQLRAGLLTEVTRTPARSRRRFTGIVITAAATLTVAGAAAAWVSMTRPDDPNEGYCSSSVTLDPDVWTTHGVITAFDAQGNRDPLDGLEACAQAWRMGILTAPNVPPGQVPALTACVVEGNLVIYPGDPTTCQRLGVPAAITDR